MRTSSGTSIGPSVYEADREDWCFPTELDLPPKMQSSFRRLNDCMRVLYELRGPTVVNWGFGLWTLGGFFWCYPLFKDELKIFKNWVETGEIEEKYLHRRMCTGGLRLLSEQFSVPLVFPGYDVQLDFPWAAGWPCGCKPPTLVLTPQTGSSSIDL